MPSINARQAQEKARERVGALARLLEQQARDVRGRAAHQTSHRGAEALMAPAWRVAARDHEIRAAFGLAEQHRDELGRMLQVGVHDADIQPASHVQPGDDRRAQAALAVGSLTEEAADRRVGLGQVEEQIPGAVVAVVDKADLERSGGECGGDPADQGLDVVRLVAGRNDEADDWRAAARPFGGHGQRIGAKPRDGETPGDRRSRESLRGWPRRAARSG